MAGILDDIASVLDERLTPSLVGQTTHDGAEYLLVEQQGEDESALSLVTVHGKDIKLVTSEVVPGDPALTSVPRDVLRTLLPSYSFTAPKDEPPAITAGSDQRSRADISSALHSTAKAMVGSDQMNSAKLSPAETRNGHLACAWAVNRISTMALGGPVGGGLSTASMYKALRTNHIAFDEEQLLPGLIIISPTTGENVGHVGITGVDDLIYSNSSSKGMWLQNRTLKSWSDYYHLKKGLPILFYQLNPARFPGRATS